MSTATAPDLRDLLSDPERLVATAHAAGYRFARGSGWYCRTLRCGCLLGLAARLADPESVGVDAILHDVEAIKRGKPPLSGRWPADSGRTREELFGMIAGFDAGSPSPWRAGDTLYRLGYEFGEAVARIARELQGSLDPEPPELGDDAAERDALVPGGSPDPIATPISESCVDPCLIPGPTANTERTDAWHRQTPPKSSGSTSSWPWRP